MSCLLKLLKGRLRGRDMARTVVRTFLRLDIPRVSNKPALDCCRHLTCPVSAPRTPLLFNVSPRRASTSSILLPTCLPAFATAVLSRNIHRTQTRGFHDIHIIKKISKRPDKRLADSDSEDRLSARAFQVKSLAGYKELIESLGGCSQDYVSPQLLGAFLDKHLKGLSGSDLTVIMSFCAEAGIEFLPIVERIRCHRENSKHQGHFAFDLSYVNVLGSYVSESPQLNADLIKFYDEFVSQHNFALSSTEICKELIRAISHSTAWMKGIQMLGRLKAANDVRWSDYFHLISAAAKAGNVDVVLLLQKNYYQTKDSCPTIDGIRKINTLNMSSVWIKLLDQIIDMHERDAPSAKVNVEKILSHWRASGYIPHVDVINKLTSWFKMYRGEDAVHLDVKMPKTGDCPLSGKTLERLSLLEFDKLRSQFLDKILVKQNVFVNADPEDLSGLVQFVKTCAPFDVVIDGLNVCYHDNQLDTSPHLMIRQVLQVVKFLHVKMKKRVAVISRDWWDRAQFIPIMTELRQHASIFTTHRMTEDDLFTLHCALESGPDCFILTNDLMRDHRANCSDDLRPILAHWQHARQINVHFDRNLNKMSLVTPRQYLTTVQEIDGTLFIPHHNVTEEDMQNAHTRMDLKDGVSVDEHFRIPNSFLVINHGTSFFQSQSLPPWGSI